LDLRDQCIRPRDVTKEKVFLQSTGINAGFEVRDAILEELNTRRSPNSLTASIDIERSIAHFVACHPDCLRRVGPGSITHTNNVVRNPLQGCDGTLDKLFM